MSPVHDIRKQLELLFFGIVILTAITYGVWRSFPLVAGPHITIISPSDGSTVSSTTFQITGRVSRVKTILIQGRSIPIDKAGNFTEILVAEYPITIITIVATDSYNKTITKILHVTPK